MRNRTIAQHQQTELGEYVRRAGYETDRAFAEALSVDRPILSKIAHKTILPTVPMLKRICELLDITPLDIYEAAEIDLKNALKAVVSGRKRKREKRWRIEANIGRKNYNALKRALDAKGLTATEWVRLMIKREVAEYERTKPEVELMEVTVR